MESDYAEKESLVLRKLYEMGGAGHTDPVVIANLALELGMNQKEANQILIDLEERKALIEGDEHTVRLKQSGIELIESKGRRVPGATPNISYTTNIHGPNYGGIQQGGKLNIQNVTIHAEFKAKISELLALVQRSSLAPVQKLNAINDIRTVDELSTLEVSPEVVQEAKSRIDSVQSVISLSADLVSLGMPIVMVLRAFFGI